MAAPGTSRRAHRRAAERMRLSGWKVAVPMAAALAGTLFVASAVSSGGTDLRSSGTDLRSVVTEQAREVDALKSQVDDLQTEVDRLGAGVEDDAVRKLQQRIALVGRAAGLTAVTGPGLVVTLDDAPTDDVSDDVDANVLVVHQQDIQAFVNAMWTGGATAVSLQGRRLVSTTAVKCVGNTVVIEGVPYAPPYVIAAVGDPEALVQALDSSPNVGFYREDARTYGLVLEVDRSERMEMPGYEGRPVMVHAEPL